MMLKSEAERVIRRAIEETKAQFTEEQIQAICIIALKVANTVVEEAMASWHSSPSNRSRFLAD